MSRNPIYYKVSEQQHKELVAMHRSLKLQKRYVDRANIIILSSKGNTIDQIIEQTSLSRRAVTKWRQRFKSSGVEGLKDFPRSGRRPVITREQKLFVIQKASSKPEEGYPNWSQSRIAKEVGISQGKVSQILRETDLRPHKIDYWCSNSTDTEFVAKIISIVGLYINPPENAIIICVDEKTQEHALDGTQPMLPSKPEHSRQIHATIRRNRTLALIKALSVHSVDITVKNNYSDNAEIFFKFLKKLNRDYKGKKLHLIVDNPSLLKNEEIKKWLESKRKFTIHFTPTFSAWLNQVEIWFNLLTSDVIKGGIWESSEQLVSQLIEYIETYNKTRINPFEWIYIPEIL